MVESAATSDRQIVHPQRGRIMLVSQW